MDAATTLRTARSRAGLSQTELARRAGTSQAAVSQYESGAKQPSFETLSRLLLAAGARVTLDPVPVPPAVVASEDELQRRAGILEQVLDLAAALPFRPARELAFPALRPADG